MSVYIDMNTIPLYPVSIKEKPFLELSLYKIKLLFSKLISFIAQTLTLFRKEIN